MKIRPLLLCTIAGVLTIGAGCAAPSPELASASSVPLASTTWRLTQLGGVVVTNPEGASAVNLQLQAQNSRATGFAGCNRMFGGYALSNDTLRFEQMGSTKMACLESSRMQLEQRYLDMFSGVARWKIGGSQLELYDAQGQRLAMFEASSPPAQP
jgi:putative lipoprotein